MKKRAASAGISNTALILDNFYTFQKAEKMSGPCRDFRGSAEYKEYMNGPVRLRAPHMSR